MGLPSCPWRPLPDRPGPHASSETRPQTHCHRLPHLTSSFAIFNSLGSPQLHDQGGVGCAFSGHPRPSSQVRPLSLPRPPLPASSLHLHSTARLHSAPPTCSRCQSRVSPSSLPPPHPSYTGSARTITGKHLATHPLLLPNPSPLAPSRPAFTSENNLGLALHRSLVGTCGDTSFPWVPRTPLGPFPPSLKSSQSQQELFKEILLGVLW